MDTFHARIREVASVRYQLRQQHTNDNLGTVSGLQPTGKHWNETGNTVARNMSSDKVTVNTLNTSRDQIRSELVRAKNLSNMNGKGARFRKEDQSATKKEASTTKVLQRKSLPVIQRKSLPSATKKESTSGMCKTVDSETISTLSGGFVSKYLFIHNSWEQFNAAKQTISDFANIASLSGRTRRALFQPALFSGFLGASDRRRKNEGSRTNEQVLDIGCPNSRVL